MRKARRSEQDTLRQRLQIELGFNGTRISPAKVMTPGRDIATVNLEFKVRGHDLIGRQSHRYADPWSRVSSSIERNDYDTAGFVAVLRHRQITPHVAQNTVNRRSAIDGRTTRHPGYAISQQKRKRVEEIFGWAKTVGLFRQTRHRGVRRVGWMFTLALAVYNLVRIRNLTWPTP